MSELSGPVRSGDAVGCRFDALDLAITEAICADRFGVDADHITVTHAPDGATQLVSLTPAALGALLDAAGDDAPADIEGWVLLAETVLVEQLVDLAGEMWRAEAELTVGAALAHRLERQQSIVEQAGPLCAPVVFDTSAGAGDLLAAAFPSPHLVALV